MAQIDLFRMPKKPWNSGRIIGAKPPLKLKHIEGIRQQLRTAGKVRALCEISSCENSFCAVAR